MPKPPKNFDGKKRQKSIKLIPLAPLFSLAARCAFQPPCTLGVKIEERVLLRYRPDDDADIVTGFQSGVKWCFCEVAKDFRFFPIMQFTRGAVRGCQEEG